MLKLSYCCCVCRSLFNIQQSAPVCTLEIGLYGFIVQKLLYKFKINTHSAGILNENYFIAVVWQERKLVKNYFTLRLNYLREIGLQMAANNFCS